MPKRITPEQIETARTAFRNGKSIPECCQIASMSKASFNKYLGSEMKVWLEEHQQAKEQKDRINEIIPTPPNFESDSQPMTDDQWISLIQYEFEQVNNYEQARELYYEYKPEAIINITRVEAFRAIYEQTLDRTTKSKPNSNKIVNRDSVSDNGFVANNLPQNKVLVSSDLPPGRLEIGKRIKDIRETLDIKIPMPRKSSMVKWDDTRLAEHILYWLWRPNRDTYFNSIGICKLLRSYPTSEDRWKVINKAVRELSLPLPERKVSQIKGLVSELEELGMTKQEVISKL